MYSTLSWTRTLVFFFERRALSLFLVRGAFFAMGLEGLLVAAAGVGRGGLVRNGAAAAATEVTQALTALVLGDLGRRPAQARPDLVGDDFDHRALLALLGLPRPLLESPGHEDAGALLQ